jgi:hypothetical protein
MHTSITHQPRQLRPHYRLYQPENTTLYPIIEQNLPVLREALQQQQASLPGFVLAEFEDYLRCGLLGHGFVPVKCNGCRHEHLAWPAACLLLQATLLSQATRLLSFLWRSSNDRNVGPPR